MATISFDRVSKHYDKFVAIPEVNFEVRDREFLVLVGPSGCGKSTLLRMIAGLEEITGGELRIGSQVVNDLPPKDRDIAIVFQNYALYPHMTAYENMAFGLKIRKVPKPEIDNRVRHAARILDIENLLDRKPKAMSGGQRQRIAIGRAIVRDPSVFLFDEPLSNLDAKLRGQMRLEIARLHRKLQTTVVYVTHDQVEAMTLGDRIVVLRAGEIQQIDTPQNLYAHPANRFVAGFIGSPPMNFIDGHLRPQGTRLQFVERNQQLNFILPEKSALRPHVDKPITLGFRPEHAQTVSEDTSIPLDVQVQYVERLGHEGFAACLLGDQEVRVRLTEGVLNTEPGPLRVYLPPDRLYFFDGKTGRVIA